MSTPWRPGNDPRLITSLSMAKATDIEARLGDLLAGMGPVAPGLVYGSTGTTVTQNVNGSYTWTCPAGVTQAKIECWAAGAGGNGGNATNGGFGGGGGEYACEPAYPVVPGQVYTYVVGNGGSGATTNNPGQDGSDTLFDNGGVYANAGTQFHAGTGSTNTIHNDGGAGGGSTANGGGGGGGSGGATGNGGTAANANSNTGTAGGSAGAGGGAIGGTGGNNGSNGTNGGLPGGGGGAAGAAVITGGSSGSSQYRLTNSATYRGSDASGGAANTFRSDAGSSMMQGGTTASGGSYNGTQKALGIIGGNPQGDLSGKIIDSVSVRFQWTHTWYNNGAYVILGYTSRTSTPVSWNGAGITGVKTWWQGSVGSTRTTDLTGQGLGSALQSGAAKSLALGPGGGYNLNNYGTMYGAGGSNGSNPLLTVSWHTSGTTGTAKGGAGQDGQVKITYQVSGVLTAAVQPTADVDAGGNAFAVGYTGPVTAIQPASSPSVVETWHDFPAGINSWGLGTGGWKKYRLLPTGSLEVSISLRAAGTKADGTAVFGAGALPAGYVPVLGRKLIPVVVNQNALSANWSPVFSFNTDGSVTVFGVNTATLNSVDCHGTIPLI